MVPTREAGIAAFDAAMRAAARSGRTLLSEPQAKRVLAAFGIAVPRAVEVPGGDQVEAAAALKPPFAVKVIAAGIVHKSDRGGVRLNVATLAEARTVIDGMRREIAPSGCAIDGFLIEEMAPKGHEIVIGSVRDPSFGPLVMFGLGGIFVEVLRDVAFRICPIVADDAVDMISEIKGAAVLHGARGGIAVPDRVLIDALLAIGGADGLLTSLGDRLEELDVNPMIVSPEGAVAVDARMVIGRRS